MFGCPLQFIMTGSYRFSKNLVNWCRKASNDIQAMHFSTRGIVHQVLATGAWQTYMYLKQE